MQILRPPARSLLPPCAWLIAMLRSQPVSLSRSRKFGMGTVRIWSSATAAADAGETVPSSVLLVFFAWVRFLFQSDSVGRWACKCRETRERIANSVRGNRARTTSTLFEWLWPRAWLQLQLRLHSRTCVCLCVGEEEQQQRKIVKHKDQKKRNNNNIGNTEERRRVGDRVLLLLLLKVRSEVCFCFCFYCVVLLSLAYLGLACCVALCCESQLLAAAVLVNNCKWPWRDLITV